MCVAWARARRSLSLPSVMSLPATLLSPSLPSVMSLPATLLSATLLSVMLLSVMLLAATLLSACGAVGESGGGADPGLVSGSGPFRPLRSDPAYDELSVPFVLSDAVVDLDDPFVVAWGEQLAMWVTARRSSMTDIEHADALALEHGFGALYQALVADRAWEAGAVTQPSVIAGDPVVLGGEWVLFYAGGGALGWATAAAVTLGHDWTKAPGPALEANGLEEGHLLSSPSVVLIDDRVRVYYLGDGRLWAAEASAADVFARRATYWTRLDGNPETAARDPMLEVPSWATALGRVTARATVTPARRWRHDLYFTALTTATAGQAAVSTCGFAASFSGDRFVTAETPILPLDQARHAPTEIPYRRGALLLFVQRHGSTDAIAAATSP
jgi:hypothetical protein